MSNQLVILVRSTSFVFWFIKMWTLISRGNSVNSHLMEDFRKDFANSTLCSCQLLERSRHPLVGAEPMHVAQPPVGSHRLLSSRWFFGLPVSEVFVALFFWRFSELHGANGVLRCLCIPLLMCLFYVWRCVFICRIVASYFKINILSTWTSISPQ